MASNECQIMGLPAIGCKTFGTLDFMRVPCPAASRMAVTFIRHLQPSPLSNWGRRSKGNKNRPAGASECEPRSTAPKAGVLPLHHAPKRGKLYHRLFFILAGGQSQLTRLLV